MKHARWLSRRTAVTVLTLVALSVATLCVSGGVANAAVTSAKSSTCAGAPLKFTAIITKSGPGVTAVSGTDVVDGIQSALHAINDQCTAGAPLQITLCDDKSDPNASNACGRAAKSDGSLAIVVSAGSVDGGAQTSGLPVLLTGGLGNYELTSPNSYPADSPITEIFGSISASSAAHVKSYLMLAADSPAVHALSDTLIPLAKSQGVKLDFQFFPADTTDFAPVAAQAAAQHPEAIGLAVGAITPVINALKIEGITPKNTPMFTAVALVTPQIKKELGAKVEGINLISTAVPAQQTSNPGIKQMLKELKAAGVKTKPADIDTQTAETWAHTHMLAEVIGKLSAADRAALTSDSLVAALVAASPLTNDVVAPIDYTTKAFPSVPALSPLRLFGNQVITVRVENGKYVPITAFQNATEPFKLLKGAGGK